jgi:predicted alpha/beta-hydrolase family hydrolase
MEAMKQLALGTVFLGGHSYGGRQASLLVASDPGLADGLLLLSYPLHPPRRPSELRTAHFPTLRTPALFVHGSRDGFGTLDEVTAALKLIPARTRLLPIEGAGHELLAKQNRELLPARVVETFRSFVQGGAT